MVLTKNDISIEVTVSHHSGRHQIPSRPVTPALPRNSQSAGKKTLLRRLIQLSLYTALPLPSSYLWRHGLESTISYNSKKSHIFPFGRRRPKFFSNYSLLSLLPIMFPLLRGNLATSLLALRLTAKVSRSRSLPPAAFLCS